MSLRSPIGAVLGSGAARGAAHHWWTQRLTAVALVPLAIWFVASLVALPSLDFLAVRSWLAAGWNPVWLSLLVIVAAWHSLLGVQVVIEDYIHAHAAKTVLLVVSIFFHVVVGAAGLFAVVKAALLGPDPS